MATIFDSRTRLVPTWIEAIRHVATQGETFNVLLEIADPISMTAEEDVAIKKVDEALRTYDDSSLVYVAGTIFPVRYANKHQRAVLYDRFVDLMEAKGKKKGTWGTYAMRIMRRATQDGESIYPLETIITKLARASQDGHPYKAAYELGVVEPNDDIFPYEIQTYDGAIDAGKISNMPCLSHLSFKMINRTHVNLTAVYRSHYYCSKALGNLIGLRDLLVFVARESGLKVGSLTCLSSFAKFDSKAWGGKLAADALLKLI